MPMDTVNSTNSSGNPLMGQRDILKSKGLGQQDFLKLMIAQAQNQDPMDPKSSGDFLGQLAQFSTNDGITKMQESIQQLASSLQSTQALQATSMVGRKILVNSENLTLGKEGETKAAVNLPAEVDQLTAAIYSESGELVRKIPLGKQNAGLFNFSWDGFNQNGQRMPEGKYSVKVNGLYSGREVALKTMTTAKVDSVSLGQNGEGIRLNVAGVGQVALNDVKQITD